MPKIPDSHKARIRTKTQARRKTRAFAPPDFPDTIVLEYGKALIAEVNKIDALLKEILFPHLEKITNTKDERLDSTIKLDLELRELAGVGLVVELMRRIKSKFYGEFLQDEAEPSQRLFTRSMRRVADKHLRRGNNFAEKKFVSEFERQTGTMPLPQQLNVEAFIKDATRKNVALIKTIPQRYFSQIQTLVEQSVDRGQLSREVKKELLKIKKSTKNSARLLARDQIGKLVSVTEEARQRNLGVEFYIWRDSSDIRVRSFANSNGASDHKRLDGALIPWNRPPQTVFKGKRSGERNHAGMDIQCRCGSQPVYDDITGIEHPDTKRGREISKRLGLL